MKLDNRKQVFELLDSTASASEPMRTQLTERFGNDGCYYEAIQWLKQGFRPLRNPNDERGPLRTDYNPDSRKLRAIDNDVTRLTQKSIASTEPDQIYMDVQPSERNCSPDAAYRASVHENFVNALIDDSGFLTAAQVANERRCIFGVWGIVLGLETTEQGRYICTTDFDPSCLILDPFVQKRNLHEHSVVIYQDTWLIDRIEKAFGEKLDPEKCKTVEQLESQRIELAEISQRKMFSKYVRFSRSKAAKVSQIHVRDGRRFGQWFVVIEDGYNDKRMVNEDDDRTPFGGVGMPFTLLHGYPRADTMWSWGEPAQLKDDQDQKNLLKTLDNRILQNYAHSRPVIDRRFFGAHSANDDDAIKQMTNQVGRPLIGSGSDRVRNIQPPFYLQAPPPPQFVVDHLDRHTAAMVSKTHKAPGNFGLSQTHTPFSTTQRVLDDADQVTSVRIRRDLKSYNYITQVLHATGIRLAQEKDPELAALMRREEFEPQDIAVVLQTDPTYPDVVMTVQESTVRHQSHASRKADLDQAAERGMVTAEQYQSIMADTLQIPLDDADRQMVDQARKAANRVIMGEEWVPIPLGQWNKVFIDTFTRAQMDARVRADNAARARLAAAIQGQYSMQYQERLLANPELAAQVGAASQGGETPESETEDPGVEADQAVNVADVLDALSRGGGSSVGAQPASAA